MLNKAEFLQRQSNRVFDQKIALEKTFARDLKRYFAEQRRNVRDGKAIDTIEPILKKHYNRIIRDFTRPEKKQDINTSTLETYVDTRAKSQAAIIDETTEKQLKRSIELAKEDLKKDGIELPGEAVILLIASRIFANYSRGRVGNISITETQTVAESIREEITTLAHTEMENAIIDIDADKMNEIADFSGDWTTYDIVNGIGILSALEMLRRLAEATKTWFTRDDGLVRGSGVYDKFDHISANGQSVRVSQPFIVSGQRLRFPGDFSLGASAGNVCRCRCNAAY